ncbi:SpoIIE family protein phosphatase [Blastococcus sp. URHD0036]|uniref:SpoIIE family protein phosphatase n=1 Tax=Blastococcus sp. URHD0036 TaxID=1380356 RepID=UPI001E487FBC|nr:SpoIIE family protein phosphatase [Blastococcus sp. URHD0036]
MPRADDDLAMSRVVAQSGAGSQAGLVASASAVMSGRGGGGRPTASLPGVLAEAPVAVLLIDRSAGEVTFANTAAVELAGNVHLPVPVDAWGAAAGLTDLGGAPLASTTGPLSLVAQGQPVTGEAVRLAPGRSTEAERARADDGSQDRLLWVTGFPLSHGDDEGAPLSLVVFLDVATPTEADDPETALQSLRDRAVIATDITFTISDPRRPDDPLIWVNPSFTRITGYSYDEAVGRNCRFLQGPATDPAAVDEIRAALAERRTLTTTLLNYRKDGTAFWNQLSISPVFDGEGELVSFVGVQTDVTERVRVEHERERAFAAEQTARHEAELARATAEQARSDAEGARLQVEQATERLALMAEATSTLIATLDMSDLLDRLAGLCVPLLADWVFLTLVDEHGEVVETAYRHRDGREEQLRSFSTVHALHLPPGSPSLQSMRSSRPTLIDRDRDRIEAAFAVDAAREAFDSLGGHSVLTVPMVARRRTRGAMALVLSSQERTFTQKDVDLAEDLSRRAALAMDNVRLYQQEHAVADTLQRSLLPELPEIPGTTAAAHYVSASTAADVGGDFYDLLQLPDGSVGLVIGDVVGHDIAAAAAMGHLRGLIRACVWDAPDPDPGVVLGRVDRLVQGLRIASMATMAYARATPPTEPGEPWRVHLADAGHPPLLLREPGGAVRVLDQVSGLLVGVDAGAQRPAVVLDVPAGSTLLAYTDGLIERPGLDLDLGIAELVERIAATPADASPRALCDAAVAGTLDGRDDVAVIAVRLG